MMPVLHFKNISLLVSLSLASAKIKEMIIEEPKKSVSIRPQLHLILEGRMGHVKSTIMQEISMHHNPKLNVYTNVTFPSIVGTLDSQTKQIIPPVTWDIRDSTFLMDEFKWTDKSNTIDAMLQLMESQTYSRRFGLFSVENSEKDGDLFFRVTNGQILLKTRFNLILTTMRNLSRSKDIGIKALCSRCLLYKYRLTRKELEKIAKGEEFLEVTEFSPPKRVVVDKKIYRKIMGIVNRSDIDDSNYLRAIGDCCRTYAVMNKFDSKTLKFITSLHSKKRRGEDVRP